MNKLYTRKKYRKKTSKNKKKEIIKIQKNI